MKRFFVIGTLTALIMPLFAQPKVQQEKWILNNTKRMTDSNTSFYDVYSNYDFPYYVPTKDDITEKLIRITDYLEKNSTKNIVDAVGNVITNYKQIKPDFKLGDSDYRIYVYTWGVTYTGMLKAYQATKNEKFRDYTIPRLRLIYDVVPSVEKLKKKDQNYRSPFDRIIEPETLDQTGALCAAMIQWSRDGNLNFSLRSYIDTYMDFIMQKQYRLEDGTIARKGPYDTTLWLDDMYMGIPPLVQMYALTKEKKYLDDAVNQVLRFSERMFVPETNLFMHGYVTTMDVHPQYYWGRANGWATMAMCELLDYLPKDHPEYKNVLNIFQKHCWGLLQYQSGQGMWRQLLDRFDSYPESSGTAMFVYGLAKGINSGWLDDRAFGPAALLGWNALSDQINNMGQIENVCVGSGIAYEWAYYYYRNVNVNAAHGYGPVLMAGAEIITMIDKFNIKNGNSILFNGVKS